jgi:hypothetical protein
MAQYEDLEIDQGTDVVISLECFNTDGSKRILNYFDLVEDTYLSYYTVNSYIKKTYNSSDSDRIAFTGTTISPDEELNMIYLTLTNEQTDAMKPGRYVYDVELMSYDSATSTTIVERILEGKINVTPSVTK